MAASRFRPLIGITGPRRGALGPRLCVHLAIWLAGGRTLHLRPGDDGRHLDCHALVVLGGHDIDPVLYAAQPEVHPRHDKERDAFESLLIDYALERCLPLLGICRGAQLLNVRLGGTLFQELKSLRLRTSNRRTLLPLKTLLVEPGTYLRELIGAPRGRINSLHNQGIDQLGEGLEISGRDLDGIVQAVEATECDFVIGVQWHPEFLFFIQRQRRLFRALVQAASRYQEGDR